MPQTLAHTRRLRERVTLPGTRTTTDLGGGATETTRTDGQTVAARVRPLRGREHMQARQMVAGRTYEVWMRYPLPGGEEIKASDRITWHSRQGDKTLHLMDPPTLVEAQRYLTFQATYKEEA